MNEFLETTKPSECLDYEKITFNAIRWLLAATEWADVSYHRKRGGVDKEDLHRKLKTDHNQFKKKELVQEEQEELLRSVPQDGSEKHPLSQHRSQATNWRYKEADKCKDSQSCKTKSRTDRQKEEIVSRLSSIVNENDKEKENHNIFLQAEGEVLRPEYEGQTDGKTNPSVLKEEVFVKHRSKNIQASSQWNFKSKKRGRKEDDCDSKSQSQTPKCSETSSKQTSFLKNKIRASMDCALSSAPGHQVALLEPTATVASGDADCDASISNARESDQLGGDGAVFDDSDDYISCDDCECLYDGDCPEHGPLNIIRDVKVPVGEPDRARRTVPRQLAILPSKIEGAGEGVWTREPLPRRTRFGPYEGTIRPTHTETGYGWEVVRFGKAIHCIDASDVRTSNWVRYVNCARNVVEENLHSFQYKGQLYYRTTCDVPAHTELLVWYGDSYGQELGIDPESFHKPVDKPECLSGTFPCGDCYLAFVSPLLLEKHKRHSHCIAELRRRRAAGGVHPTKDSQTALKPSSPSKQCPSKPSGSSIQCQPSKYSESSKQWRPSTPSESSKQWRPSTPSESSKQWRPSKPSEASKPSESSKQCHPPKPSESSRSWRPSKPLESSKPSESSRSWRPSKPLESSKPSESSRSWRLSKPSESSTSWRPSKPPEQKASSSPADQKVRTSDACGKTLEERRSLIISKRSVLPAVVFSCEVCSAPHPSIERLRTHMSIHNSETPFKCRKCDAAFKLRACLVRHMWIHADKKPWKCKICEESFGEAAHLQRHMRAHTNEKLYVCQTCDATFSFRKDFIRHLFTHTAKKSIPCPTCDLTFSSEIRLKKHMLSHSEETLFKCRYCIAYLRDESSLIKHMLAHNRKDPLKCITREAAFNQPNQMPHEEPLKSLTGETVNKVTIACPRLL